jgi:structural maintenance of chromosome 2
LQETEQLLIEADQNSLKITNECHETIKTHNEAVESVSSLENLVQTLTTGLTSTKGQENGYMDQLSTAKKINSDAISETQQLKININHLAKQLKESEPRARTAQKENNTLMSELERQKNIMESIKEDLLNVSYDIEKEKELEIKKGSKVKEVSQLTNNIEQLKGGMEFKYNDPIPNFDRKLVKGLIAELVDIPIENLDSTLALEVCAGGRLYNVVIENEVVGKQLLSKGKLQKRVTFIPLNKISPYNVEPARIACAKKLVPGKVDIALSLIRSDLKVSQAMKYVFGSTLIAKDINSAKVCTFDKNVQLKSVTLDGDVYDPSGQLTGGAKSNSSGFLTKMQNFKSLSRKLENAQSELILIETELEEVQNSNQYYMQMTQKLENKTHEIQLLESRLSNNPHFKLIQNVEKMKEEMKTSELDLDLAVEKHNAARERVLFIEKEMNELTHNRDDKLKSLKGLFIYRRIKLLVGKKVLRSLVLWLQQWKKRWHWLKKRLDN